LALEGIWAGHSPAGETVKGLGEAAGQGKLAYGRRAYKKVSMSHPAADDAALQPFLDRLMANDLFHTSKIQA